MKGVVLSCLFHASHRLRPSAYYQSINHLSTYLVKDCIDILVTPIASIVNISLSAGCFPSHSKSALVSPLLKKPTLKKDNLKNYRPVSNLGFLSKLVEKFVTNCLNSHINSSNCPITTSVLTIYFTQLKLLFFKSTTIFCLHVILAQSQLWLCSTFPLRLIPSTILFY